MMEHLISIFEVILGGLFLALFVIASARNASSEDEDDWNEVEHRFKTVRYYPRGNVFSTPRYEPKIVTYIDDEELEAEMVSRKI